MGNINCIASGGAPHRADITITNNTKYELILNIEENCGRDCDHKGWQILEGNTKQSSRPLEVLGRVQFPLHRVHQLARALQQGWHFSIGQRY